MTKVGFTCGSFDIIHPGYIRLLKDAKRVCDYLIVGLHEDPSITRPKTKAKPIFSKEERLEILMAIRYVDEVRFYKTEDELILLLLEIKPDVRILGSDYLQNHVTGRGIVPTMYYHARDHDWSVTKVRKMIQEETK